MTLCVGGSSLVQNLIQNLIHTKFKGKKLEKRTFVVTVQFATKCYSISGNTTTKKGNTRSIESSWMIVRSKMQTGNIFSATFSPAAVSLVQPTIGRSLQADGDRRTQEHPNSL